jgi:hypothetical protein
MPDKLDQAREKVLDRIIEWAGKPTCATAPAHLRNLAAVYDILNDRHRRAPLPGPRQIDQQGSLRIR